MFKNIFFPVFLATIVRNTIKVKDHEEHGTYPADISRAREQKLSLLFYRTKHFFSWDMDAAGCHELACVSPDRLCLVAGIDRFFGPGAGILSNTFCWCFG